MKALVSLLPLILLFTCNAFGQAPIDYRDVGLIININDSNSVAIGDYFMSKRDIPERNVIRIQAPDRKAHV